MRVGSLFTGYGGLDMAVGGDLAWYSEIEPAACTVLAAHYPDVPNLGDITAVDWSAVEPVEVITGGYPCQPFSHAGKRKGTKDERHLWPYVRDAISALRPSLAVLENVRGHLSLGLADVIGDLAGLGYDARWGVVRASDAGAPHGRARVFITAYPTRGARGAWSGRGVSESERTTGLTARSGISSDTNGGGCQQCGFVPVEIQGKQDGHRATCCGSLAGNSTGEGLEGRRLSKRSGQGYALPVTAQGCGFGLATDTNSDGHGQQLHARGMGGMEGQTESSPQQRQRTWREFDSGVDWGQYAPAIHRWEPIVGRPAPAPTVQHKNKPRLNPVFVEWMMGLPEGHVTGHGLTPAQELKMLGNGVVPQQAALALRLLGVA